MAAEKNSISASNDEKARKKSSKPVIPIHKQAYLGLALASFTVFSVVTGLVKPYPDTWSWESSADFFNSAHSIWTIAAIIYYPVIFGYANSCKKLYIRRLMGRLPINNSSHTQAYYILDL